MIRSLAVERKVRLPLQTVVCSNCGFIINKRSPDGLWTRRSNSNRQHCPDCQGRFARAIALAHSRIETLIKRGKMESWEGKLCVDCSAPAAFYDLRNYSRPLEVAPICKSCNCVRGPGILGERYAK